MEIETFRDTRVTVLVVGGTGESFAGDDRTTVTGMLAAVTDCLDDRFAARWVGYPASYGPTPQLDGVSYRQSLTVGERHLRDALRATIGPVMLIGYSQGAVVIRAVLHDLWRSGDPMLRRVLAAGFVADPHQPPGVVDGCDGWGVAGPGPDLPPGLATYWVGAADDVICNAGADSLVRDIADLTASMALQRPREWAQQLWTLVRHNAFQNASRTSISLTQMRRDVGRIGAAAREVLGYLPRVMRWHGVAVTNRLGGRHTSYAREPYRRASRTDPDTTGCQALAAWMQVCATFAPPHDPYASPMADCDSRAV
ncbi:PE-PPE domain-containing protein [Gordonia sp. CPCC 205515]|uniref:PE-PPE domain-containing protein n=1 Tax=Gordonia sp. CPCC 205515 TaxID=3140791 RepID=UPI003AF3D786